MGGVPCIDAFAKRVYCISKKNKASSSFGSSFVKRVYEREKDAPNMAEANIE